MIRVPIVLVGFERILHQNHPFGSGIAFRRTHQDCVSPTELLDLGVELEAVVLACVNINDAI